MVKKMIKDINTLNDQLKQADSEVEIQEKVIHEISTKMVKLAAGKVTPPSSYACNIL